MGQYWKQISFRILHIYIIVKETSFVEGDCYVLYIW